MKTRLIKKIMVLAITTMTVIGMSSIGASAAWRQNGHGWWNSKGDSYSVGWEKVGGNWFYFDQDGYMKNGWLNDGGKWYYLNSNGDMATGWLQDGGKWYYLNPSGDMFFNAFINGYRLGVDGAWIDNNFTNVTTGAAANVIVDPAINSTTDAAVTLPANNSNKYDKYFDKYNKKKNKLENLIDKYQKKLDEQVQKQA